jgi:hypothetical protein
VRHLLVRGAFGEKAGDIGLTQLRAFQGRGFHGRFTFASGAMTPSALGFEKGGAIFG